MNVEFVSFVRIGLCFSGKKQLQYITMILIWFLFRLYLKLASLQDPVHILWWNQLELNTAV